VVVENFESFLKVDFSLFDEDWFLYLGGESNKRVREFLKDKDVLAFVDFDFFGISIFENLRCKTKKLFLPPNLEELIVKYGSVDLYEEQRFKASKLKLDTFESEKLFDLIMKHSKCLEQEILDENKRCN
jgi:hypothetical protein